MGRVRDRINSALESREQKKQSSPQQERDQSHIISYERDNYKEQPQDKEAEKMHEQTQQRKVSDIA